MSKQTPSQYCLTKHKFHLYSSYLQYYVEATPSSSLSFILLQIEYELAISIRARKRNLYCIYKLWLCICKSQNPHQPHAETDSFMKNGGLIGSLRGASATPDHHQKSTLLRCLDQEMRRGGRLNKGPIFPE